MAYAHPLIDILFLMSVLVLWAMIFYQLFFTYAGYIYRRRALKEKDLFSARNISDLPPVSILIPAHNEALVIEKSLAALLGLIYPQDRLEIIVIDDGSTDDTAGIVDRVAKTDPRVRLFAVPPEEAAQGKSHALNLGLQTASHDLVAVYDADNRPEPESLKFLAMALMDRPDLTSVFGKFRTLNKGKNLLTRFINIETLSFQYMVQAGRYLVSGIAILPGTNFLIRRQALIQSGGWDEAALTEDTELSIRLYEQGHEIKFLPYAVTWEEEPEKWGTWVKQRTRWVRGNFYVLRKFLLPSLGFRKRSLTLELIYLFLLYYLFLGSILLSHLFFIASCLGWIAVLSPGPYFAVWVCAFALFVVELSLTAAYDDELTIKNIGVILLMYFTYCQAWIILVFRAIYQEFRQKGKVQWEKTRRFGTS